MNLLDAPRAAAAAPHVGDGIANAGILPVPGDECRYRNVAGMAAAARDSERAAAETAKPPPFEAQLAILPGGDLGLAGAWRTVLEKGVEGGFRRWFRRRFPRPEPA